MLRRKGYRVYYLGANTPVEDLTEMVESVDPIALMVSASIKESVAKLLAGREYFQHMKTEIIFGGLGFKAQPELARSIGGIYFEGNIQELMSYLETITDRSKTT